MSTENNRVNHRKVEPPAVAQVWVTELERGDEIVTAAGIRRIRDVVEIEHQGKSNVVVSFADGGQLCWKGKGRALLVFG